MWLDDFTFRTAFARLPARNKLKWWDLGFGCPLVQVKLARMLKNCHRSGNIYGRFGFGN
jgi:hypothetical protein